MKKIKVITLVVVMFLGIILCSPVVVTTPTVDAYYTEEKAPEDIIVETETLIDEIEVVIEVPNEIQEEILITGTPNVECVYEIAPTEIEFYQENTGNVFFLESRDYYQGKLVKISDTFALVSSDTFAFEPGKGNTFYFEFQEDYPLNDISVYVLDKEDANLTLEETILNYKDDVWLKENNCTVFHTEEISTIAGDGILNVCTYTKYSETADYIELWLVYDDTTMLNICFTGEDLHVYDAFVCMEEFFALCWRNLY